MIFIIAKRYVYTENFKKKKQILFLSLGTSFFLIPLFTLAIVTNFFDNYSIELYSLFSIIPFLGTLSYLVIKHQIFDIKVIAAQFLTVTVWLGVFSQFFIVQERSNQILTGVTLALVTVFGYMLFKAVKEEVKISEELSLASRKLAGLNAKLEELDRAKSEFISIASHQLRTPLTSVKGFTSLILDKTFGRIPVAQKKAVEKVFVNNEKLCLLVEDMLNASRLEAGRLEYELEEADVVSIVKSTIEVIKLYAKSKGIKLVLKIGVDPRVPPSPSAADGQSKPEDDNKRSEDDKLIAIVDQRKLSEIVSNLIDNAIKYTPRGSITVSVEKFQKKQRIGEIPRQTIQGKTAKNITTNGNWARVSVRDTGVGMDEKQLSSIFEKFKEGNESSQLPIISDRKKSLDPPVPPSPSAPSSAGASADESDRQSKPEDDNKGNISNGNGSNVTAGTGLGVYISRQMAQAMGGKLYATSPGKNKGSTFILELPLVKK